MMGFWADHSLAAIDSSVSKRSGRNDSGRRAAPPGETTPAMKMHCHGHSEKRPSNYQNSGSFIGFSHWRNGSRETINIAENIICASAREPAARRASVSARRWQASARHQCRFDKFGSFHSGALISTLQISKIIALSLVFSPPRKTLQRSVNSAKFPSLVFWHSILLISLLCHLLDGNSWLVTFINFRAMSTLQPLMDFWEKCKKITPEYY